MADRVLIMIEKYESLNMVHRLRFFYAFSTGLIHVEWSDGSSLILDRKQSPQSYCRQMHELFYPDETVNFL